VKQIADAVSVKANPRQRVKPRSGGRSQNGGCEKLGVAGRAAPAAGE
jgi:hypothetical protein